MEVLFFVTILICCSQLTDTTTISTDTTTTATTPSTTTTAVTTPGNQNQYSCFPYGLLVGDDILTGDDISVVIHLSAPFIFGCKKYRKLHIGTNGCVCFDTECSDFRSRPFNHRSSKCKKRICPLWTDIVVRRATQGATYFQLYEEEQYGVFARYNDAVNDHTDNTDFSATLVLVITWENVEQAGQRGKLASFQLVLATDGDQSFAFFCYGSNNWNRRRKRGYIIGYYHDTEIFFNHIYSDTSDALRMNQLTGNTFINGQWLYEVTGCTAEKRAMNRAERKCRKWHSKEHRNRRNYESMANSWRCPCNEMQVWFTRGLRWSWNLRCYVFRWSWFNTMSCCYGRWGELIREIPGAGHLMRYSPFSRRRNNYINNDLRPKQWCCEQSDLCELFYEVRPRGWRCRSIIIIIIIWMRGDPHITTLDKKDYTFNGYGEYWLAKVDDGNGYTLDAQARTDLAESSDGTQKKNATIFSAIAGRDSLGGSFHIQLTPNRTAMAIYVDGVDWTREFDADDDYEVNNDYVAAYKQNGSFVVAFSKDISFTVALQEKTLTISTAIPDQYKGKVVGLLGNYNDDSTDDFRPQNTLATPLSTNATDREIFTQFGETWKVEASEDHLFQYLSDAKPADYYFPDFVPMFEDEIDPVVRSNAEAQCGNNAQCIYDIAVTDNQELGLNNINVTIEADRQDTVIQNSAPIIFVDSTVINAVIGEQTTIDFVANDTDGDTVTFEVYDKPAASTFNMDTGQFLWTPADTSIVRLSIGAYDDSTNQARSEALEMIIQVCDCNTANSNCSFDLPRITNGSFTISSCQCEIGYEGDICDTVILGCDVSPCDSQQNCTDLPPADQAIFGRAYNCSGCPVGWENIEGKCEDIDECNSTALNNCDQSCVNNEGSYDCDCIEGYRMVAEICEDINECEERSHTCKQICTNTAGSFTCSCLPYYTLSADGVTCDADQAAVDMCTAAGCPDLCSNETGSVQCSCPHGYELGANGKSCQDANECDASPCSQGCLNTPVGSFTCTCRAGYYLGTDKITCIECIANSYGVDCAEKCGCSQYASACDPVRGCICNQGWSGVNCTTDINECDISSTSLCAADRTCTNTAGGYTCDCLDGYEEDDNGNCEDIDECTLIGCDAVTEDCTNTPGSFLCLCKSGYIRQTTDANCTDIDECKIYKDICEHICQNKEGIYNCDCFKWYFLTDDRRTCHPDPAVVTDYCELEGLVCSYGCANITKVKCVCPRGAHLAADKQTCIDTDECKDNPCSHTCTNLHFTLGTFTCSCPTGYILNADKATCRVCDSTNWGLDCIKNCSCGTGAETCHHETGCVCKSGWTGLYCTIDKDECALNLLTCGANSLCVNTDGSAGCVCNEGYTDDGSGNCKDIDECTLALNARPCQHECVNSDGSYTCSCYAGFYLNTDGKTCKDIDECETGTHQCMHRCRNTPGGYACRCYDDFKLSPLDMKTCLPTEECVTSNCEQECFANATGNYCVCHAGYTLNSNGTNCDDILECANNPCDATYGSCTETIPGYQCTCEDGSFLLDDSTTCQACEKGKFGTACNQTCTCITANTELCFKTNGTCKCLSGWEGTNCETNINECKSASPPTCTANSACEDRDGSYECVCASGFYKVKDGSTESCSACDQGFYAVGCLSKCECVLDNSVCDTVNGSCYCNTGFEGSRCETDIDNCTAASCATKPNSVCVDKVNDFECTCRSGYKEDGNGQCTDIDECFDSTLNTCSKPEWCQNTVGSYSCVTSGCVNKEICTTPAPTSTTAPATSASTSATPVSCGDGKELTVGSTCQPCSRGFYRKASDSDTCIQCPQGKSTTVTGSTSRADCSMNANTYNFDVKITMDETGIDFNDPESTEYKKRLAEINEQLNSYYKGEIGEPGFIGATVTKLQPGVVASHELAVQRSENTISKASKAVSDLTDHSFNIDGKASPVSSVSFGNSQLTSETKDPCEVRAHIEPISQGSTCVNGASMVLKSESDDWALTVGLGAGIPLGLLGMAVTGIICFAAMRRRRRRHKSEVRSIQSDDLSDGTGSKIFSSTLAKRKWYEQPHSYMGVPGPYRPQDFGGGPLEAAERPHVDNTPFSWDFMNKYLAPDETMTIDRPNVHRNGHSDI